MTSTDTSANVTDAGVPPHEWRRGVLGGPRTVALGWLASYLAISGIVLLVGNRPGLAALHAALIALAAASWVRDARYGGRNPAGAAWRAIGDLLPLFVAPLLYGEIPALIAALGSGYHDTLIQGWEAVAFGGQPSSVLAGAMPWRAVSEVLHAGYLAYYPSIFVPPLLLYWKAERRALAQTVLALTVTFTVCWTIFAFFPVEGPRYLWAAPPGVPDGPARRLAVALLAAGSSRGAAFPSSHMAVMAAQTVMAFRWQPRAGWVLTVLALLIGLGAVYGGFHYAVDMVAGAPLGAACAAMVLVFSKPDLGFRARAAQ